MDAAGQVYGYKINERNYSRVKCILVKGDTILILGLLLVVSTKSCMHEDLEYVVFEVFLITWC